MRPPYPGFVSAWLVPQTGDPPWGDSKSLRLQAGRTARRPLDHTTGPAVSFYGREAKNQDFDRIVFGQYMRESISQGNRFAHVFPKYYPIDFYILSYYMRESISQMMRTVYWT